RPTGSLSEAEDRIKVIVAEYARVIGTLEVILRGPGESTMRVQDSRNAPAPGNLFRPAVAVEDGRCPYPKQFEYVLDVIVRGGVPGREVPLIERARIGVRPGIHSMAKTILRFQHERLAERMPRAQQQCVEASIPVVVIHGNAVNDRVERDARHSSGVVEVVVGREVTCLAPLVTC